MVSDPTYFSLLSKTEPNYKDFERPLDKYDARLKQHFNIISEILNKALEELDEIEKLEKMKWKRPCCSYTIWTLCCPITTIIGLCQICISNDCNKGDVICANSYRLFGISDEASKLRNQKELEGYIMSASNLSGVTNTTITKDFINKKLEQINKFKDPEYRALSYSLWMKNSTIDKFLEEPERADRKLPIFTVLSDIYIKWIDYTLDYRKEITEFFNNRVKSLFNIGFPRDLSKLIESYIFIDLTEIPPIYENFVPLNFGETDQVTLEINQSISKFYRPFKVNLTDQWGAITEKSFSDSTQAKVTQRRIEEIKIDMQELKEDSDSSEEFSETAPLI